MKINSQRLSKLFTDLVKIDSPSGEETRVIKYIKKYLRTLNVPAKQDSRGNLYARIPGKTGEAPLVLCAHLDTVEPGRGIVPVFKKGVFTSRGATILGADDKSGVAEILELLTTIKDGFVNERSIEILFTVDEERGATGARAVRPEWLKGREMLILDAGESGKITTAAPFIFEYEVELTGRAAHSGAEPEKGRNALLVAARAIADIPVGRIDDRSTANVGFLASGQAINAVPASATFKGEIRSHERSRADKIFAQTKAAVESAAKPLGVRASIHRELWCEGYCYSHTDPHIKKAVKLMKLVGIRPRLKVSGGASDANTLVGKDFRPLDIGAGYKNPHMTTETVKLKDMVRVVELLQRYVND